MKKRLIVLLIAVLAAGVTLAACGKKDGAEAVELGYEMIYGFESQEEINSIKAFWDFGKMQVSSDRVTEGKSSMRLEVHGTYPDYHFVFGDWKSIDDQYLLFYARDNKYMRQDTTDWTKFSELTLDIANDSDRDVPVQMILTTTTVRYRGNAETETENDVYIGSYTVKRGSGMQTARFRIPAAARLNDLDSVKYVKLIFPNREEGQTPAVLYVDNFRGKLAETPQQLTKSFAENEIALFESDLDANAWYTSFESCQYKSRFTYAACADPAYTTEGNRSLEIRRAPSPRTYNWDGRVTANLGRQYLDKIDFAAKDASALAIAVDLYSVSPVDENVLFSVAADKSTLTKSALLTPGIWTTVTIPMAWNNGEWEKVYGLGLTMNEFTGSADRMLYVDNIRFVPAG